MKHSRLLALVLLCLAPVAGFAQAPVPNDPFQSVPPPTLLPRPAPTQPAPRPPHAAPARHGYPVAIGQSFRDCRDCPEMVVIPAGRFLMGSPASEDGRKADEGPQREVVVNRPLAVGKFEVTFAEWDACVAAGGCSHRPDDAGWGRGNRPVINVSWNDAQEYVRWLSRRTGRTYRLLTEAEWEYAARAGTTTAFSTGQAITPPAANFGSHIGRTQPAGSYPANTWGLHDMHGNVWEWVADCYRADYAAAPRDAAQPVSPEGCERRVLRGGSWANFEGSLRSASRLASSPGNRVNTDGFRVARAPGT